MRKERITITIDQDLLNELDNQVDGLTIKNRSHAIELNLEKIIKRKKIHQAIILAGGRHEVTVDGKTIPSVMATVNSKPVLEHNIRSLKKQGISEFIIAVRKNKELIKNYFEDGKSLGVKVSYVEDDNPLGTAGVIRKSAEHLTGTFIVTNGNIIKDINIQQMFDFHKKQGAVATIAVTTRPNPQNYGVVIMNGNKVFSFLEKPEKSPTNIINGGLYILELDSIKHTPEGFGMLEQDVFPKLARNEDLAGYLFYSDWQDVRSQESLELARTLWQKRTI